MRLTASLLALLLMSAFSGCGGDASPPPATPTPAETTTPAEPASSAPTGRARWRHVVWIVMENKNYDDVIGSSEAPYTTSLAAKYGLATDYHAVAHPSLPNYIAMTSGSTYGIEDDDDPSAHPLDAPSIFSQVEDWRALQESMPSNCDLGDDGQYAVKHNPPAYFTGLRAACMERDVPLEPPPDVSARFTFVTPNLCHDTHDCGVPVGDAWLARFVPELMASAPYRAGSTVIFLTWDEDDDSDDNRVPMIVMSPRTLGQRSDARFTHYSLLRTTEELLGVPLLGSAGSAPSMRAAFGL